MTRVGIVGAGFVGTATGAALLHYNPSIKLTFFDVDKAAFGRPRSVLKNLDFETTILLDDAIAKADYVFVAVPTPMGKNSAYDYSILDSIIQRISKSVPTNAVIAIRSTIGTDKIASLVEMFHARFWLMPEFLTEANYINDALNPARIVIGTTDTSPNLELLRNFKAPIHVVSPMEACLVKLFANCALATKISFFNELAMLGAYGVDVQKIADIIAQDPRIGSYGTKVGWPYAGKCLPKEVNAIVKLFPYLKIISSTQKVNLALGGQ